jgi:hypothetical protein
LCRAYILCPSSLLPTTPRLGHGPIPVDELTDVRLLQIFYQVVWVQVQCPMAIVQMRIVHTEKRGSDIEKGDDIMEKGNLEGVFAKDTRLMRVTYILCLVLSAICPICQLAECNCINYSHLTTRHVSAAGIVPCCSRGYKYKKIPKLATRPRGSYLKH